MNKVQILLESGWQELKINKDSYELRDVAVTIQEDGNVCVCADTTAILGLKIEWENKYFTDGLVKGDSWERAYGDLWWRKPDYNRIMPWYFMAYDRNKTYGFGVKTLPNTFCSWRCDDRRITLEIDTKNGSQGLILNGRILNACTIVFFEGTGDLFETEKKFCKTLCDNPRFPGRIIYGGNDWYCNYGDNSFEKIMILTKRIVECSRGCALKPYIVIDDGWELCHHQSDDLDRYYNGGPWKYCNDNFSDMKIMANAIDKEGAIPGIWFRPLWTVEKYPERYILKTDGMKDTLDPSVPEVLDIIKEDVKRLCKWGYKLIKHDFSTWDIFGKWGFEMENNMYKEECVFFDKTKTTAEIIKNMYLAIREATDEDVLVMGCNTFSHLSAGIFDIQRTGDDTSGLDWERTKKYGINTLAFRMPQHNNFYAVDADCVGITKNVPWSKNCQWLDVLSKSGTPLFVSIADDAYNDDVKRAVTKAFERACECKNTSKPIDCFETLIPRKWKSDYGNDEYEW